MSMIELFRLKGRRQISMIELSCVYRIPSHETFLHIHLFNYLCLVKAGLQLHIFL